MSYQRTLIWRAVPNSVLVAGAGLLAGSALVIAGVHSSPLLGLLVVLGLILSAALFLSPSFAFLLAAAVIPLERIGRLTSDSNMYTMSVMRIVGVLALASFLLHVALKKWPVHFGLAFILYAVFCDWGLSTVAFTSDVIGGVRAASAVLGNLLFFFLVINMARSWRMANLAVAVWLLSCSIIGIYTIYEWHSGKSRIDETDLGATSVRFSTVLKDTSEWDTLGISVDRALGTTSSPAVHAINMILTVPFYFFVIRTRREWYWKVLALVGGLVALYNIFLTNTRAAILVGGAVVLLCLLWRMVTITPRVVFAIVVFGGAMIALSPGAVFERVFRLGNYTYQGSGTLQTRMEYWKAGLRIAEEHWATGVGLGNQAVVPAAANVEGPEESTVHDEYLEMLIETGIFGWAIFFGFVGLLLGCALRAASVFRKVPDYESPYWLVVACVIAMISVLLYGLQVDVFHFPLKGWWLVAGLSWTFYQTSMTVKQKAMAERNVVAGAH